MIIITIENGTVHSAHSTHSEELLIHYFDSEQRHEQWVEAGVSKSIMDLPRELRMLTRRWDVEEGES